MSESTPRASRTIAFYSRISVWTALLFLASGLAIQSVHINMFAQNDVDQAFAQAMADQMSHTLSLRLQETHRLQKSASEHPYSLDSLTEPNLEWLALLHQFLPGALNVLILTRDEVIGLNERYGFAVEDLARRTLDGTDMQLEAVQRSGALQFFRATPIFDDNKHVAGVLLVEYGNQWLASFQSMVSKHPGQVRVTQYMLGDQARGIDIVATGKPSARTGAVITTAINDVWFLTYIPADERPQLEVMPLITPWIVILIAIIASMFIFLALQKRDIKRNKLKLLTYVRTLGRKGKNERPQFTLDLFDDLADDMLHIVRTTRTVDEPDSTNSRRTKPDIAFEPPRRTPVNKVTPRVVDTPTPVFEVEEIEDEKPWK